MIAHTQTFVGNGEAGSTPGNCLQAALASLLDLPLEQVPHFALFEKGWGAAVVLWLRDQGKEMRVFNDWEDHKKWWGDLGVKASDLAYRPSDQMMIATGHSPNGAWLHSVVWKGVEIAHDPHPGQKGLVGFPIEFWQIVDAPEWPVA